MIERYTGDCNIDFAPQELYFERGDVEATGGIEQLPAEILFDVPEELQREVQGLTEGEIAEDLAQEQSKAEIDRISRLDAEGRWREGQKDSYRGFGAAKKIRKLNRITGPAGIDYTDNSAIRQRDRMVEAHLGLAVKFAAKWWLQEHLKRTDLLQMGVFGLFNAVKKHNSAKAKFSTYASIWIRHEMQRGIDNTERVIRWPVSEEEIYRPINHAIGKISQYTRDMPVEVDELETYFADNPQIGREQIEDYFSLPRADIALDDVEPDILAIEDEGLEQIEANDVVISAIKKLRELELVPDSYINVLARNLGLFGTERETLREIDESFGNDRGCASRSKKQALRKIAVFIES